MQKRRLSPLTICAASFLYIFCAWGKFNHLTAEVLRPSTVHDQETAADSNASRGLACKAVEVTGEMNGVNSAPSVVPALQKWGGGKGVWTISARSRILIEPANAASLSPAAIQLSKDIAEVSGVKLAVVAGTDVRADDIALSLSPCSARVREQIGAEGYTLLADRGVILRANPAKEPNDQASGLFYATRTLLQMLTISKDHRTIPQGFAIDYPRYQERAVMFDTGRAFADKEFLKAYMRFMGWYKLNILALHLSDDVLDRTPGPGSIGRSGFRLHSTNPDFKNPPLSDDGLYYSKSDWDELEDVAAANGITIIPEIDAPGHAGAMVAAIKKAYSDTHSKGVELDVSDPRTLAYVESVWNEFLPWFRSKTVHIGADEAASSKEAQTQFVLNFEKFLQEKGKRVRMWNDIVSGSAPFDKGTIIYRWDGNITWTTPKFDWVNASSSFYVTPDAGAYQESRGFAGDSFYADDSTLKIAHPGNGEIWDWFGNTATATKDKNYVPIGGQVSLWNDMEFHHPYTYEGLVHYLLKDVVPAAGQIWWSGQQFDSKGTLVPYAVLREEVAQLQYGPGATNVPMFSKQPLPSKTPTFETPPPYSTRPTYLAQDAQLSGTASPASCKSCDGGEVEHLGKSDGGEGSLTFSISVSADGLYMLPIYYVSGSSTAINGQVRVNRGDAIIAVFPPTGGVSSADHSHLTPEDEKTLLSPMDQQSIMAIFVPLKSGSNSIELFNPANAMPNIGGLGTPILQPKR